MLNQKRLQVFLPDGWAETDHGNPRQYRNVSLPRGGWLTISVRPPRPGVSGTDRKEDQVLLRQLLQFVGREKWGPPLRTHAGPCSLGRLATAVFRAPRIGLVQVWLLARRDVSVFANFLPGDPQTAEKELEDAQAILESVDQVNAVDAPDESLVTPAS